MKDETGAMARAVQQMRSKLRAMVALIDQAGIKMGDNVTGLTVNMSEVNDICNNNSATTEELAAAMEEAASATDTVNQTIASTFGKRCYTVNGSDGTCEPVKDNDGKCRKTYR